MAENTSSCERMLMLKEADALINQGVEPLKKMDGTIAYKRQTYLQDPRLAVLAKICKECEIRHLPTLLQDIEINRPYFEFYGTFKYNVVSRFQMTKKVLTHRLKLSITDVMLKMYKRGGYNKNHTHIILEHKKQNLLYDVDDKQIVVFNLNLFEIKEFSFKTNEFGMFVDKKGECFKLGVKNMWFTKKEYSTGLYLFPSTYSTRQKNYIHQYTNSESKAVLF